MSSPASGPRRADVPTPTPRRLYIHDDLSEELRRHGEGAPAWLLWRALLTLLVREPERAVVLTPESQIAALIAGREHAPFGTTVAIGAAGAPAARLLRAPGVDGRVVPGRRARRRRGVPRAPRPPRGRCASPAVRPRRAARAG